MTQGEADKEIARLINLAIRVEVHRDKQTYESPRYWRFHDQAIRYHLRAEALMPKGPKCPTCKHRRAE